jgi:ABC-type uncharacterized transport system ATPase subunit
MTTTDGAAPIKTEGLTKHYGDVKALVDLDLEVQRGEVFGFLGPNGAGKTTTIRSLLHFVFPTAGSASVLGLDVATDAVAVRSRISYMPSEYAMYPKLTGAENLAYLANLRGGVDTGYVNELAERLEVELDRKVSDLSTGNKQKVGLIQAIRRIDLEFEEPVEASVFEHANGVRAAESRGNTVVVSFEGSVNELLRIAIEHDVVNVNSREADLEQIFLEYYHGNGDDVA